MISGSDKAGQPIPRHAPFEIIDSYDKQSVAGVLVVPGAPAGRIVIAPDSHKLSLEVRAINNVPGPDLRDKANLYYDVEEEAGLMWHRLDVTYDGNLAEVYPVLCTILDLVQLDGDDFAEAVESVIGGLSDILLGRGGLSREKQIGLFGELVVLLSLARGTSPQEALGAWRGPDSEEHDFGLSDVDLEVKTTTSERRGHWIGSVTQLVPTGERPLHLVSIQITGAGNGPGASLADLVHAARQLPGIVRSDLDKTLQTVGYRDHHADLYTSRWTLRSAGAFHLVDNAFPAITPDRVAAAVPNAARVTDLQYRIDLDGLTATAALFPISLQEAQSQ